MKTLLLIAVMAILCGCYSQKEIQVDMVRVKLVKIDTVYRYDNNSYNDDRIQQFTWQDDRNIEYVSFASMQTNYIVGTNIMFLRKR
jgi:hypothetical protein